MANNIDLDLRLQTNIDKTLKRLDKAFDSLENSANKVANSISKIESNLGRATTQASKTTASLKKMVGSVTKVAAGVGAAVTAISAFVGVKLASEAIEAAASMEDLTTQFIAFTGSAEAANRQVQELRDFAAATPFQLEGIAKSARSLLAFGTEQEKVLPRLKLLGELASGTGSDLGELANIFGKIQATGKLTGDRFQELIDRGINIGPVLAKNLGVAESSLEDLRAKGKISSQDVLKAFESMAGAGGMFEGSLKRLSGTSSGLFSTLKDNIANTFATIGGIFDPVIKQTLRFSTELVQQLGKFVDENRQVLAEGFRDIVVQVLNYIADMTKGFSQNFAQMAKFIDTFVNLAAGSFKVFLNGIDAILFAIGKAVQGVAFLREKAGSFFGSEETVKDAQRTQKIYEDFTDSIAKRVDDRSKEIKANFEDAFSFDESERSFVTKVVGAVDKVESKIRQFSKAIADTKIDLKVGATVVPKVQSKAIDETLNKIKTKLQEAANALVTFSKELTNILVSGTKTMRSDLDAIEAKTLEIQEKRAKLESTHIKNVGQFNAEFLKEQKQIQEELVQLEKEKEELTKKQKDNIKDAGAAAVSSAAAAVTDIFLPGAGQFVSALLEVARDPEAFKLFVEGFVKAIPEIIQSLSDAMPDVILTLIENAPQISLAIIEGITRLSGRLLEVFAKLLVQGAVLFLNKLGEKISELVRPIADFLKPIFDGFASAVQLISDAFQKFAEVLDAFDPSKLGQGGTFGKFLGGDIGGGFADIGGALGLASGGAVRVKGADSSRDTVPAMLANGELVVDRNTTAKLDNFLSTQSGSFNATQDNSVVVQVLEAILTVLQTPTQVANTIDIDGRQLASVITELKRNGQIA